MRINPSMCPVTQACVSSRNLAPSRKYVSHHASMCPITQLCALSRNHVPHHANVPHHASTCPITQACVPSRKHASHYLTMCTVAQPFVPSRNHVSRHATMRPVKQSKVSVSRQSPLFLLNIAIRARCGFVFLNQSIVCSIANLLSNTFIRCLMGTLTSFQS